MGVWEPGKVGIRTLLLGSADTTPSSGSATRAKARGREDSSSRLRAGGRESAGLASPTRVEGAAGAPSPATRQPSRCRGVHTLSSNPTPRLSNRRPGEKFQPRLPSPSIRPTLATALGGAPGRAWGPVHGGGNPHRPTPGAARPTADGAKRQETPGKRPGSAVNDRGGASRAAKREPVSEARQARAEAPQPGNFWPPPQRLGGECGQAGRGGGGEAGSARSRAYPENERLLPCPPPAG